MTQQYHQYTGMQQKNHQMQQQNHQLQQQILQQQKFRLDKVVTILIQIAQNGFFFFVLKNETGNGSNKKLKNKKNVPRQLEILQQQQRRR